MQTFRWGILGTVTIANNMAQALSAAPKAELVAVASCVSIPKPLLLSASLLPRP